MHRPMNMAAKAASKAIADGDGSPLNYLHAAALEQQPKQRERLLFDVGERIAKADDAEAEAAAIVSAFLEAPLQTDDGADIPDELAEHLEEGEPSSGGMTDSTVAMRASKPEPRTPAEIEGACKALHVAVRIRGDLSDTVTAAADALLQRCKRMQKADPQNDGPVNTLLRACKLLLDGVEAAGTLPSEGAEAEAREDDEAVAEAMRDIDPASQDYERKLAFARQAARDWRALERAGHGRRTQVDHIRVHLQANPHPNPLAR